MRIASDSVVLIISDMHIGDGATEPFANKDDLLRGFLDRVASRADALIIAGDGFDLAQAGSVERIYRSHRALIDDLAALGAACPSTRSRATTMDRGPGCASCFRRSTEPR